MVHDFPELPTLHLVRGVENPVVAEVRDRLTRLGFLRESESPADPQIFDTTLDRAVRAFQQDRGMLVDGIVGRDTFRRLEEARWNIGDRVISFSAGHLTTGDDVAQLQQRLNTFGFDAGRIDGVFGPDTDRAMREFQRNVGLEVDGTCGPEVWRALDRLTRTVKGGIPAALRSEHNYQLTRTGVADKVVVIDPGHGGPDHGNVGFRLAESIIADDLARQVEGRLAAIGTQVLLTRGMSYELDQPMDEASRATFANETGADLVVSLHTAAAPSPHARGVATYFFGHANDESVLGARFADLVQEEIVSRTDLVDCRTHPKTWDLLRQTRMPAVRVEIGYLTNESDATRLADATFRNAVAEAVAVAVVRYFAPTESKDGTG